MNTGERASQRDGDVSGFYSHWTHPSTRRLTPQSPTECQSSAQLKTSPSFPFYKTSLSLSPPGLQSKHTNTSYPISDAHTRPHNSFQIKDESLHCMKAFMGPMQILCTMLKRSRI